MLLKPVWIDDFLSEEEFSYWSKLTPSQHQQRIVAVGKGPHEILLYDKCTQVCEALLPDRILIHKQDFPVMNQVPVGRERALHNDPGMISCVYHTCPEWSGGGELFIPGYNISTRYVPNRLVVFDADIHHRVFPSSQHRYSAHVAFLVER